MNFTWSGYFSNMCVKVFNIATGPVTSRVPRISHRLELSPDSEGRWHVAALRCLTFMK